jgi:hypothetical protein
MIAPEMGVFVLTASNEFDGCQWKQALSLLGRPADEFIHRTPFIRYYSVRHARMLLAGIHFNDGQDALIIALDSR